MKKSACIVAIILSNLVCATPFNKRPLGNFPTDNSSFIQPSLHADASMLRAMRHMPRMMKIDEEEPQVVCDPTDFNPLEYKDGVEMLKTYCERNWVATGSVYAAIVGTTAVYVCSQTKSNQVCQSTEWDSAEFLINQRCGTGRMGTAEVNHKIYGRGYPDEYRC